MGKSNELAHAAATGVAEKPGGLYNPLVMYADVGLGKTHLMQAIGHAVAQRGMSLIYATTEEFTNSYIKAIREGTTEDFREHYRTADVLLLDDLQFLIGKEQMQEGFFHTFNALHMTNRQIVLTSDRPVSGLKLLEDRIQSRLAGGLVVDIQTPDVETRIAILRAKAEGSRQHVCDDALLFLAERVHRNIRELEGGLNRVLALADLTGQPVTDRLWSSAPSRTCWARTLLDRHSTGLRRSVRGRRVILQPRRPKCSERDASARPKDRPGPTGRHVPPPRGIRPQTGRHRRAPWADKIPQHRHARL